VPRSFSRRKSCVELQCCGSSSFENALVDGRGHEHWGGGGAQVCERDERAGGAVAEQAGDEGGVHGVAGALGDDAAEDLVAGEGEVADEVEYFVADELVGKAERAADNAAAGDDDGVGVGDAADQAHVAEFLLVFAEAEGARGRDGFAVGAGGEVERDVLQADGRGEVDAVGDGVAVAGVDAEEFVAVADLDRLEDAEVLAAAALHFEAGVLDGFDVRQGGAVEDGEFEIVELDDDVVDGEAGEGGEQVLGGGDEHALAHEAGGVGDFGDVAAGGGDLEVFKIGAAEDDAGAGGGGQQAHGHRRPAVQADAGETEGRGDRLLKVHTLRKARWLGQAGAPVGLIP
jgi:hypothetical protein